MHHEHLFISHSANYIVYAPYYMTMTYIHYTVFDAAISSISLTQYDGTMEYQYRSSRSRPDSLVRTGFVIHNAEGYQEYAYITSAASHTIQMPPRFPIVRVTRYYYHRDHLGNNCAVWDATNNSIAQRTWYYAGGTPMPVSTAQGIQPYKYNGKEYVEAHGYDAYDYGFRGYYATIGRFTSIDPLTERTPWQSPYIYANNNWINLIDYAGLFGMDKDAFASNFTVVNKDYKVIYHDDDNGTGVYMWLGDDDFELGENGSIPWGLLGILGWELPYATYFRGMSCLYVTIDIPQGGYGPNTYASAQIMKGNRIASRSDLAEWMMKVPTSVKLVCTLGIETIQSLILGNIGGYAPYIATGIELSTNAYNLQLQNDQSRYLIVYSTTFSLLSLVGGLPVVLMATMGEYAVTSFAECMSEQIVPSINGYIYNAYYDAYAY